MCPHAFPAFGEISHSIAISGVCREGALPALDICHVQVPKLSVMDRSDLNRTR